jgi:hypothetical protein
MISGGVRHAWGEPVRSDHHTTYRGCMRPGCGMCKVSRHEGRENWTEWYRMPDLSRVIMSDGRSPPCDPTRNI